MKKKKYRKDIELKMELEYIVEDNESLPITGASHLENHINYLLRTDKAQKWTNIWTPNNRIALCADTKIYTCKELEHRKELKAKLKKDIIGFFEKKFGKVNLNEILPEYLFMFCLFLYDSDIDDVISPKDIMTFDINNILQEFDAYDDATLFSLTFHQDQTNNPSHLHGLYYFGNNKYDKDYDRIFDILQ